MYHPFVFKLDTGNSNILDSGPSKSNIILSSNVNLPLSSLGFHTFIHRTRSAMSITKSLQTQNQFYYVVNPFEHSIANYQDSLINLSKVYFNIQGENNDILSRSFYKMWEMLFLFDIADKKDLEYASISENPSAFIQAVLLYREKIGSGISNDKIFSVGINSKKNTDITKQFMNLYNGQIPGLLDIRYLSNGKLVKLNKKPKPNQNGETLKLDQDGGAPKPSPIQPHIETISLFKQTIVKSKKYADLITADGSLETDDENFQEQESYQLILGSIIAAIKTQAKSGSFVLKIFDTFTLCTIKMIYLLSSFYSTVHIYKPFFSRPSNSEKYLICKDFNYDQVSDAELLKKKISTLEHLLEMMVGNKYVFDIFPGMNLPSEYLDKFKFMNVKLVNPQQIMVNSIVTYIKENNYYGDKYHKYRQKQIEATQWWVNNFYPPSNNINASTKTTLAKLLANSLEISNVEQTKFLTNLIK
jgi:23S rRNA U2552 (ribose-2'-O)-methylase RlmE/FtsJ